MIQQDKIEHWAFGFVLTLFAIIDINLLFLGFVFAFGKETYDYVIKRRWDWNDIVATCWGILSAYGFLAIVI